MGSAYQDLPGLVWDQKLGMPIIGNFPVGSRLSLFLSAWISSDQFVLGVVSQGYSLPFVSLPLLSRIHVEASLSCLRLKRKVLWEEVASLLTKGGHGDCPVITGPGVGVGWGGGCYSTISRLPSALGGSPHPQPLGTQHVPLCFEVLYGDPQFYYSGFTSGLVGGVAGSQGCLPACADSSTSLAVSSVWNSEGKLIVY